MRKQYLTAIYVFAYSRLNVSKECLPQPVPASWGCLVEVGSLPAGAVKHTSGAQGSLGNLSIWVVHLACSASPSELDAQGEWRLRDLREALRDHRVHAEGLSRKLRAASGRWHAARTELLTLELRYGLADRKFQQRHKPCCNQKCPASPGGSTSD